MIIEESQAEFEINNSISSLFHEEMLIMEEIERLNHIIYCLNHYKEYFWTTKENKKIYIIDLEDNHLKNLRKFICKSSNEYTSTYRFLFQVESIRRQRLKKGKDTKKDFEKIISYCKRKIFFLQKDLKENDNFLEEII